MDTYETTIWFIPGVSAEELARFVGVVPQAERPRIEGRVRVVTLTSLAELPAATTRPQGDTPEEA